MSEILFAAERLLPAAGGAERFALEALGHLARAGHRVRAIWIEGEAAPGAVDALPQGVEGRALAPPPETPYWQQRRLRRERIGIAVEQALVERPANVVICQLHAAPAAVAAGAARGCRTVLLLPSYESLCKLAFDEDSRCQAVAGPRAGRRADCGGCPGSAFLDPTERSELARSRAAHGGALAAADVLVAPSHHLALRCREWSGREATIVRPIGEPVTPLSPLDRNGPVVFAAARWSPNKGRDLLVSLARALAPRRLRVSSAGLDPEHIRALEAIASVELVEPAPIAELLAGACALAVPSQWEEPFGRVAFEAMSAGLPVLASKLGGLSELVPSSELIETPASIDEWRAALERLSDAETWEAARLRAGSRARELLAEQPLVQLEALVCTE